MIILIILNYDFRNWNRIRYRRDDKEKRRIRYFDELCERVLSVCEREGVCVCAV